MADAQWHSLSVRTSVLTAERREPPGEFPSDLRFLTGQLALFRHKVRFLTGQLALFRYKVRFLTGQLALFRYKVSAIGPASPAESCRAFGTGRTIVQSLMISRNTEAIVTEISKLLGERHQLVPRLCLGTH